MSRREARVERAAWAVAPPPPPSKCAKVLYYTWKLCSVVFSHLVMISLVVAYCILGAVTFERLEADYEREVKRNISQIRSNTTQSIWALTRAALLLDRANWTGEVVHMLKDFESSLLREMKARGWDGNENTDHIQWTFTGALFYSIIVITTIGYGHITPKTQAGKVVTIFYAILGIPLMLLCLSNIGDVMASSFRLLWFLYWRVCCYVCTRPPKKRQRHVSTRRSVRARPGSTRRKKPLERAHSDTDFRYRDSGYSSGRARRSRPVAGPVGVPPRTRSQPPNYNMFDQEYDREERSAIKKRDPRDEHILEQEGENRDFPKISLPLQDLAAALQDLEDHQIKYNVNPRSKSLPRPAKHNTDYRQRYADNRCDENEDDNENNMLEMHDLHDVDFENFKERKALEEREKNRKFRIDDDYDGYKDRGYDPEDDDFEFDTPRYRNTWDGRRGRGRSEYEDRDMMDRRPRGRRARSAAVHDYSRWEDAGREEGSGVRADVEQGRRKRLRRLHTVEDTRYAHDEDRYSPSPARDEWSDEEMVAHQRRRHTGWNERQLEVVAVAPEPREEIKPVPIWLCVCLVASYIVAGTVLFTRWEGWPYLDAAYFCFITLTTIGFGDFVPAQGATGRAGGASGAVDAAAAVHSIALCSLYLLFGIALLAMSFNLVQEEVRANVAALAMRLGIIKPRRDPDDSDDEY